MKTEIQHAVTFLVETLKEKLPNTPDIDDKLQAMRTRLSDLLAERYENHWYVDKPLKGSAFRCINISTEDNSIDVALRRAASESGISEEAIRGVFCNGLALWIDPDDVSGRIGKGAIFPIYKKIADNRTVIQENPTPGSHRPQQRPRSISPPQALSSCPEIVPSRPITTTISSRPSKTPPGFRSLDAGQNFYNVQSHNVPQQQQRSDFNNIQKLWRNQPAHARSTASSQQQMSNVRNPPTYIPASKYNSDDAVYSFNQYSSYYNPHFQWRKDSTHTTHEGSTANANANTNTNTNTNTKGSYIPLKSLWQDEESYQRTHWFSDSNKSNTNKLAVAGNNLAINKVQNYGYGISRQAQEVY